MSLKIASLGVLVSTAVATAAPITVPNFSFESPDIADGATQAFSTGSVIPNFTFVSPGNNSSSRVTDPVDATYPGTTGNPGSTSIPGTGNGHQYAFINVGTDNSGTASLTTSASLGTFSSGTQYTLTAAFSQSAGAAGVANGSLQLLAKNGTAPAVVVAQNNFTAADLTSTTFVDRTAVLTIANAAPFVGQNIFVRVVQQRTTAVNFTQQLRVDNIRLNTAVPEPGSAALLAAGLAMAGLRRRRLK